MRYHRLEQYFAGDAALWTDCPGNELRRQDGTVLARAVPVAGEPKLALDFLGDPYANGEPFIAGDVIGHTDKDYRVAYKRLCAERPELKHVIYGRVVTEGGTVWLQYWFWYFYNAGHIAPGGLHEGDWEMVQLRMAGHIPDLAVYSQHRGHEARVWADVAKVGDRPIVYVALGSHASYFEPGLHRGYDLTDDGDDVIDPRLDVIDPATHKWMLWKGHWGDTRQGTDKLGSNSPTSPGRKQQWSRPTTWANQAA